MLYLQVENCSKFWFQPKSERPKIEQFCRELNENMESTQLIRSCTDHTPLIDAKIIVARDHKRKKLYRARLVSWDLDPMSGMFRATVCFIDFGHTQRCQLKDLYIFNERKIEQQTLPARCFPCKLAAIQPSMSNISGGNMWDQESLDLFTSFINEREVTAEVSISIMIFVKVFSSKNSFLFCRFTRL